MSLIKDIIDIYKENPVGQMGPWLVGAVFDFVAAGFLLSQFFFYWRYFPNDKPAVKWLVGIVALLNVLKTAQCFEIIFVKFVVGFGDYARATVHPPLQTLEPLMTAIIGMVVQTYFAYRCWAVAGRSWLLVGVLAVLMWVALGGAIALTIMIFEMPDASAQATFQAAVIINLAAAFAADFVITITMFIHLMRSKTGFLNTDTLIDRLIKLLWHAAIPPSICAVLNLVLYVTDAEKNFVFIIFNIALAKLYSIAMMHTLNARADIRKDLYGVMEAGPAQRIASFGSDTTIRFAAADRRQGSPPLRNSILFEKSLPPIVTTDDNPPMVSPEQMSQSLRAKMPRYF